jgi:tetratricopeptide (TPR) repeat protein
MEVAVDRLQEAAAVDPASSEPWERLGAISLEQWLSAPTREAWEKFTQAAEQYRRLRPARYAQHRQRGEWYLQAYAESQQPDHLQAAIAACKAAVERSPQGALARAQLAWVLHLGGDDEAARQQADRALALDALNPHEEFALRKHRLVEPRREGSLWQMRRPESAEQSMQNLRKS